MRRDLSGLPFTGRNSRQNRGPDADRGVTFAYRQHWRDERVVARDDPDYVITCAEQRILRQRELEEVEYRLARKDATFALALRVGAALRRLKMEE